MYNSMKQQKILSVLLVCISGGGGGGSSDDGRSLLAGWLVDWSVNMAVV